MSADKLSRRAFAGGIAALALFFIHWLSKSRPKRAAK